MPMKTLLIKVMLKIVPRNNLLIKTNKLKVLFNQEKLFQNKSLLNNRRHLQKRALFKDSKIFFSNSPNLKRLLTSFNLKTTM
jgi:hypothetical protein